MKVTVIDRLHLEHPPAEIENILVDRFMLENQVALKAKHSGMTEVEFLSRLEILKAQAKMLKSSKPTLILRRMK